MSINTYSISQNKTILYEEEVDSLGKIILIRGQLIKKYKPSVIIDTGIMKGGIIMGGFSYKKSWYVKLKIGNIKDTFNIDTISQLYHESMKPYKDTCIIKKILTKENDLFIFYQLFGNEIEYQKADHLQKLNNNIYNYVSTCSVYETYKYAPFLSLKHILYDNYLITYTSNIWPDDKCDGNEAFGHFGKKQYTRYNFDTGKWHRITIQNKNKKGLNFPDSLFFPEELVIRKKEDRITTENSVYLKIAEEVFNHVTKGKCKPDEIITFPEYEHLTILFKSNCDSFFLRYNIKEKKWYKAEIIETKEINQRVVNKRKKL